MRCDSFVPFSHRIALNVNGHIYNEHLFRKILVTQLYALEQRAAFFWGLTTTLPLIFN